VAEAAQVVIGDVSGEAEADHTKRAVPAEQGPVDWKSKLSAEEYRVLREKGTEAEGTGEYDKFYPKTGYFICRGCGNPLFSAGAKFKSGCGWPSFDRCYAGSINVQPDLSHGERRIELVCVECGGHLGHLFTGEKLTEMDQRHCVNSMSMKFINDAPPSWLVVKGEGKVATYSVDKLLAVTAVQTDGKLKSVRPTSDLVLDDPRLRSAWEEARAKPRGWSVFSYAANSKTKIECRASGSKGFDELRKALVESEVNYGVLPVVVDGRNRHVFFTYVGSSTSALKRGRASMHSPYVDKFFDGTAGALPTLTTAEELEPSNVNGLLLQLFKGALTAEVQ